jgi:vacuolar-type H+-ATPase subunit F/Vma7
MSRIAVIGERDRVRGFAFAGALVAAAEDPAGARAAWRELPPDVVLVILTPAADAALQPERGGRRIRPLCAVMAT